MDFVFEFYSWCEEKNVDHYSEWHRCFQPGPNQNRINASKPLKSCKKNPCNHFSLSEETTLRLHFYYVNHYTHTKYVNSALFQIFCIVLPSIKADVISFKMIHLLGGGACCKLVWESQCHFVLRNNYPFHWWSALLEQYNLIRFETQPSELNHILFDVSLLTKGT